MGLGVCCKSNKTNKTNKISDNNFCAKKFSIVKHGPQKCLSPSSLPVSILSPDLSFDCSRVLDLRKSTDLFTMKPQTPVFSRSSHTLHSYFWRAPRFKMAAALSSFDGDSQVQSAEQYTKYVFIPNAASHLLVFALSTLKPNCSNSSACPLFIMSTTLLASKSLPDSRSRAKNVNLTLQNQ